MFRQGFFKTYRMNQSILEKIFNKQHLLMAWSARVMEANWRYKGTIQETYTTGKSWNWFMWKGPSKTPCEEGEGRFDVQKPFIPVYVLWPHWRTFCYIFFALLEIIFLLWWLKILKLWMLRKFELGNLPHQVSLL